MSDEEYAAARESLDRVNWEMDYVITYYAPTGIARKLNRFYQLDTLTGFLEKVRQRA